MTDLCVCTLHAFYSVITKMPVSDAELTASFVEALQLPSDAAPMVIINSALSKAGISRADLTPKNAVELDLIDGPPTLVGGDQIMVRAANESTGHQAMFVEKVEGVTSIVDMWGQDKASARIAIRPMSALMSGKNQLLVFRYKCDETSDEYRKLSKDLALALAANANPGLIYNALSNNCEHFASFCRTFRCDPVANLKIAATLASAVPFTLFRSFK